jgi:ABC-type polysaccharide/polyol phosphate transport system ATPase subunit
MTANAIEIDDLSKRYMLGEDQPGRSLRETLASAVRRLGRRGARQRDEIWSLRNVTFDVAEGHAIGVIGRNGAGKSTLLKILSRITEPTEGIVRTRGRVAALLEVGTGFHPELTGRENVYLNGAILGMSRRDTARRFDEIVSFAGVERFVDTPVKRYSSGMYLRLAFAVAAHLEPDILVVDEVLAVGDAEFQAKCLGRMETAEEEGRTVVFVSHNLDAVNRLCQRAVWLERGEVAGLGTTADIIDAYLRAQVDRSTEQRAADHPNASVVLQDVWVTDTDGRRMDVLRREQPFVIEVHFAIRDAMPGLDLTAYLVNMRGIEVLNEAWSDTTSQRTSGAGDYVARLVVPPVLAVGEYLVGVWFGTRYDTALHETTAHRFRLEGDMKNRPRRTLDLGLRWDVTKVHDTGATSLARSGREDRRLPAPLRGPTPTIRVEAASTFDGRDRQGQQRHADAEQPGEEQVSEPADRLRDIQDVQRGGEP